MRFISIIIASALICLSFCQDDPETDFKLTLKGSAGTKACPREDLQFCRTSSFSSCVAIPKESISSAGYDNVDNTSACYCSLTRSYYDAAQTGFLCNSGGVTSTLYNKVSTDYAWYTFLIVSFTLLLWPMLAFIYTKWLAAPVKRVFIPNLSRRGNPKTSVA